MGGWVAGVGRCGGGWVAGMVVVGWVVVLVVLGGGGGGDCGGWLGWLGWRAWWRLGGWLARMAGLVVAELILGGWHKLRSWWRLGGWWCWVARRLGVAGVVVAGRVGGAGGRVGNGRGCCG